MNTFIESIKYFITIMAELTILFIGISTIVSVIFMYIPQDKFKKWMSGKGIWGNIIGVFFGAVTPFCACSTVPVTLGLLQAGVPFGTIMSFVISSPLMDPLVFAMITAFMGWKVAIIFFMITSVTAVIFGVVLDKIGGSKLVKNVRLKGNGHVENEEVPKELKNKLKISLVKAWGSYKAVFIYMLIGVGIGAAVYGYLPEGLLVKVAGPDNPLAIPIAALIGIPLYIRVETAIPIGLALIEKGVSIGAVIALIIGGAGMAIPEMSMLASIFKKKLVAAIVGVVFATAVIAGYIFNMI